MRMRAGMLSRQPVPGSEPIWPRSRKNPAASPRRAAGWQIRRLPFPRVVEHFLVLKGVLTVGWAWSDEVIEARLGPKDMVLNQVSRPHGFRNDGIEPVLMSISVGSGMPKPPVYVCHPRDSDPSVARHFGATPGKTHAFDPNSDDQRQQEFARHILRYAKRRPVWDAGFARLVYVGEGGAPPDKYRMDMIYLPKGVAVRGYERPVEAYFVSEGCITVGWEEAGHTVEERLGPKWVMGDQYTICDPYLFTIASWIEGDGVDTTKVPRVMEHRARMLARPAVQKAVAAEGTPIP
jgi:Glutathione S-transferase, C-terminal domain